MVSAKESDNIFDEPGVKKIDISEKEGKTAYKLEPSDQNRISVYLPPLADTASGKADQQVSVILNGDTTIIRRGEYVEIPYPVYRVLRQSGQYPNL